MLCINCAWHSVNELLLPFFSKIDNKITDGRYTKPFLRKKLFKEIKSANTHGTKSGQWSARKAQYLAKKYKAMGGDYY